MSSGYSSGSGSASALPGRDVRNEGGFTFLPLAFHLKCPAQTKLTTSEGTAIKSEGQAEAG